MTELIRSLPLILLTSFLPWLVKVMVLDEKGETSEKSCQNLDALESIIIELAGSTNTVREPHGAESSGEDPKKQNSKPGQNPSETGTPDLSQEDPQESASLDKIRRRVQMVKAAPLLENIKEFTGARKAAFLMHVYFCSLSRSGGKDPKKQNSKPGQNPSETGTPDLSQKDSQESASLDKIRRRVQMVKAALLLENIKEFTGVRKAAFLMYVYFCSLSSAALYFILSPIDVSQIIDKFSESFGHVDLVVGMLIIFIIISPLLFLLVMMNGLSVNYVQQIIDDLSAGSKKVNNLRKFHKFMRRHYLWLSVGLLVVLVGVSAGLHWCYFVNGNNGHFILLVCASIVATMKILLIFNMFPNSHHYFLSEDEG